MFPHKNNYENSEGFVMTELNFLCLTNLLVIFSGEEQISFGALFYDNSTFSVGIDEPLLVFKDFEGND